MSSTTTETRTRSTSAKAPSANYQAPPQITVLNRVASIPLVSSSLDTINVTLISNAYTCSPYNLAKGLSNTALKISEPIQVRMAPLITRVDCYANMAVDMVESRYPYPFKAKPEEVASLVRERRDSATQYVNERRTNVMNVANKTIDDNLKSPALNVAQGIDQRFAPIVDYFQVAVTRLGTEHGQPGPSPESKYQYQRAMEISKNLTGQIYVYSNEQLKQMQAHSVLVQRATATAHSINDIATSSIHNAQIRIHNLSDNMLCEMQRLQTSTAQIAASLQNTATDTLHKSTTQIQSQIPPHIQEQIQKSYHELAEQLSSATNDLRDVMATKDISVQEKVKRVSKQVQDRVTPLLAKVREGVSQALARGKKQASETSDAANGQPTYAQAVSDSQTSAPQVTTIRVNGVEGQVRVE